MPTYSANADPADFGPNLLPRTTLNRAPGEALRRAQGPSVSRSSGMPIITPDNAVDYKLVIVPPNPSVDYKMIIRDLSGEAKAEAAK